MVAVCCRSTVPYRSTLRRAAIGRTHGPASDHTQASGLRSTLTYLSESFNPSGTGVPERSNRLAAGRVLLRGRVRSCRGVVSGLISASGNFVSQRCATLSPVSHIHVTLRSALVLSSSHGDPSKQPG
jgi:hypothetical protein